MIHWASPHWASLHWLARHWAGPQESVTAPGGGGGGRFAELRPAKQEPVDFEKERRRRHDEDALILALLELA